MLVLTHQLVVATQRRVETPQEEAVHLVELVVVDFSVTMWMIIMMTMITTRYDDWW